MSWVDGDELDELRTDAERYRALKRWTAHYGRLVLGCIADESDLHWEVSFGRVATLNPAPTLDAVIDAQREAERG